MANDSLNYNINANTSGFVDGVEKATASVKKLGTGSGSKRSGAAMNQIAYALDDMQYGFRGVQNNLQQFAITAGASGPVVLALTALAIGINYLIEHWDEFSSATEKSIKTAQEFAVEIAKTGGAIASVEFFASILKDSSTSARENKVAMQQLIKAGYDPAKQSIDGFVEAKKRELKITAATSVFQKELNKSYEEQAKADAKRVELKKRLADFNKEYGRNISLEQVLSGEVNSNSFGTFGKRAFYSIEALGEEIVELESKAEDIESRATSIYRRLFRSLTTQDFQGLVGEAFNSEELSGEIDKIVSKFGKGKDELAKLFVEWSKVGTTGIAELDTVFANLEPSIRDHLVETVKTVEDEATKAGKALNSAIASAFGDIGENIGEILADDDADIGEKFLQSLGTFMKTFGSALIAMGIAEQEWLKNWNPGGKIAAGLALVAAGAYVSKVYSKKNSDSGSNTGVSGPTASPTADPIDPSGSLGTFSIRGSTLVTGIDAGNRVRGTRG